MVNDYNRSPQEVLEELHTSPLGLTAAEAAARLAAHGPNKLKEAEKPSLLRRFLAQLKDPMLLMLMAAAAISAVTNALSGESFTEVFIILAVVLLNAVLGVVQESKAEAAIEALQTMTAAKCKVLRDGHQTVVENSQLVPGDVVVLEAGDAIPADGRLLECVSLKIEEAALTGESVPAAKAAELLTGQDVPLGDRKNMCYMGSTVVYGRGRAVITATGMDTEMGKIAGVLAQTEQDETPLQRKLTQLGTTLSKLVVAICVFIFIFDLVVAGDYSLTSVLSTFMVAVSLAVAAIPEGLATVVTVVLSIGVTNMSKRQRRDPAADRGGDAGLHPGHLLRQDRYPDPEQNDGGGAHGAAAAAGRRHDAVQRRHSGGRRRPGRAYRGGAGELCRGQRLSPSPSWRPGSPAAPKPPLTPAGR